MSAVEVPVAALPVSPVESLQVTGTGIVVAAAARLEKAFGLLTHTLDAVQKNNLGKGPGAVVTKSEWKDAYYSTTWAVGAAMKAWRDQTAGRARLDTVHPKTTAMYELGLAIYWDLRILIRLLEQKDIDAIEKDIAEGRLAIMFEQFCQKRYHTYVKLTKDAPVSYDYRARSVAVNSADYAYPGLQQHLGWRRQNLFYQNAIPYGQLLMLIRDMAVQDELPAMMAVRYQAAIVYAWHETVAAVIEYFEGLKLQLRYLELSYPGDYPNGAGVEAECRFSILNAHFGVISASDPAPPLSLNPASPDPYFLPKSPVAHVYGQALDGKSPEVPCVTWFDYLERARRAAGDACSTYIAAIEAEQSRQPSALLGGIDPAEIARDPSRIQNIISNLTGLNLAPDLLSNVPALRDMLGGTLSSVLEGVGRT